MSDLVDEVKKIKKYKFGSNLFFKNGLTYREAGYNLSTSTDPKIKSIGFWAIARSYLIYPNPNNIKWIPIEYLIEALKWDHENVYAYILLASIIGNENVCVNGKYYDRSHLCLMGIQYSDHSICPNESLSISYSSLGVFLPKELLFTYIPNGKIMSRLNLFIEAIKYDSDNWHPYTWLAHHLLNNNQSTILINKIPFTSSQLFIKALVLNPEDSNSYIDLAKCTPKDSYVIFPDGRKMNRYNLYLDGLKYNPNRHDVRTILRSQFLNPWTRMKHSLSLYNVKINLLFATLFLGLQKLEDMKKIIPAHQAMFEDMLEKYTRII